jgi:uncharacterized protein
MDSPHSATPPSPTTLRDSDTAMLVSEQRLASFVESLPKDVIKQEDALPTQLAVLNASPRVKLQRIYRLLDKVGAAADGHVTCTKGCSDCCKMNVTISALEARQIGEHTGRDVAALKVSKKHDDAEFLGVSCPFLASDECSIYEYRPMACRQHYNFDATPFWCHPSRALTVTVKRLSLSGVDKAYLHVAIAANAVMADIRDFFPG